MTQSKRETFVLRVLKEDGRPGCFEVLHSGRGERRYAGSLSQLMQILSGWIQEEQGPIRLTG